MTFTRTTSGISNYPKFVNSDIIVYIEGAKLINEKLESSPLDSRFYQGLFSKIVNGRSVTVKCVGNKSAALAYVQPILKSNSKNSIVVVDRDYDGITCSLLPNPAILYTYGYSWENDFWSLIIASDLIYDLTSNNQKVLELKSNLAKGARRLKVLSSLDAALQIDSKSLLRKNNGSCGIGFDFKNQHLVGLSEMKRLFSKFKATNATTSSVVKAILKKFKLVEPNKAIQGHLWCHVVINTISNMYKSTSADTMPSKKLIYSLAMTKFTNDPIKYLGDDIYDYYRNELTSRIQ